MTQEERWFARYNEVKTFIETNKRNPSKYSPEEKSLVNWVKQQRKLTNVGLLAARHPEGWRLPLKGRKNQLNIISYFFWRRKRSKKTSTPYKLPPILGSLNKKLQKPPTFSMFW